MLPGPRLVLTTIMASVVMVVLGFAQLVKLQVAHDQTAGLGPVEARFAGLAFAARADWTPVSAPRQRSLEALAPFAAIVPERPRVGDDTAAGRFPALTSPERPPPPKTPATPGAPEDSAGEAPPPEAVGIPGGGDRPAADPPVISLAALALPPANFAPALGPPEAAELEQAKVSPAPPVIHSAVGPEPEAQTTRPNASAEHAAEALPLPSVVIAAIPAETVTGQIQAAAPTDTPEPSTVTAPGPAVASLPSDAVRLPIPRPIPPQRKVQPRPTTQKAARTPARKRTPPAKRSPVSAAPADPFTALFGGSNAASPTRN